MGLQGDSAQQSQLLPMLLRQSSFYSLTLDEVQNHLGNLGKPLGSMNLDELLKNVQANENNVVVASSSAPQRQPSLAFDMAMSNKTVDQVWRDIQKSNGEKRAEQQKQVSLGEMTLEDFLVKAGAVAQGSSDMNNATQTPHAQQQNQWLQHQVPPYQQQQVQNLLQRPQQNVMGGFVHGSAVARPLPLVAGQRIEVTYPDNQRTVQSPLMGALSDTQVGGCKRVSSGDGTEKTTERKQKRMIKNRESAARSRAKKQAYTTELEIKVSLLEEENEMLKKQQMDMTEDAVYLRKRLQCSCRDAHDRRQKKGLIGTEEDVTMCTTARTEVSTEKNRFSTILTWMFGGSCKVARGIITLEGMLWCVVCVLGSILNCCCVL